MKAVLITQEAAVALQKIALLRAPVEAVGLMMPDEEILELPNRAEEGTSNFSFMPEDIVIAMELHDIDPEIVHWEDVILWHSHPSGGVGPSRTDMRHKLPRMQHLVITLMPDGDMKLTQY